ncbi:MAG: class I SAM-dependent rRNA methyltransferase [Deltaproteobacteria bacterium]|nr:MAG: class I SAM-dependent rRNA methyltransferase [Deltaproteobacteria bacterium]
MRTVVLKPGREARVRAGHPWIFSGAVAAGLDGAEPGEPVRVQAASGGYLAAGYCNPRTTIAVRVLTLEDEAIDAALVGRRVDRALALRRATLPPTLAAFRVVNGEGDQLPGVVVDRYDDFLVCQFLSVFERSEGSVRIEEGLPSARGVLAGEVPPPYLTIEEAGDRFLVDVVHGQKTGFFLDQRESRARVRELAPGRRVLNAFAYTGAFAIAAARAGAAEVVSVDTSRPALALAEAAWVANGLAPAAGRFVTADVFEFLRSTRERYDLVLVDPPPFVRRRRDVAPGLRGYKDVNLQAFRRLAPDGWLLTSCCSQHVSWAAFREVVAAAAADAGRTARVVAEAGQPVDHPVALAHPEGVYLKVLLLRA